MFQSRPTEVQSLRLPINQSRKSVLSRREDSINLLRSALDDAEDGSDSEISVYLPETTTINPKSGMLTTLNLQSPAEALETIEFSLCKNQEVEHINNQRRGLISAERRKKDERQYDRRRKEDNIIKQILEIRAHKDEQSLQRRRHLDEAYDKIDCQMFEEEMALRWAAKEVKTGLPPPGDRIVSRSTMTIVAPRSIGLSPSRSVRHQLSYPAREVAPLHPVNTQTSSPSHHYVALTGTDQHQQDLEGVDRYISTSEPTIVARQPDMNVQVANTGQQMAAKTSGDMEVLELQDKKYEQGKQDDHFCQHSADLI